MARRNGRELGPEATGQRALGRWEQHDLQPAHVESLEHRAGLEGGDAWLPGGANGEDAMRVRRSELPASPSLMSTRGMSLGVSLLYLV